MTGSWTVQYKDGSILHQYDKGSEHFIAEAGEVPYRAINWLEVSELILESADAQTRLTIGPVSEGNKLSLRSRHFKTMLDSEPFFCFMIVESEADKEVNDESVKWVVYWFPNGVVHECASFNCPDISSYAAKVVHEQPASLMPTTNTVQVKVEAVIE